MHLPIITLLSFLNVQTYLFNAMPGKILKQIVKIIGPTFPKFNFPFSFKIRAVFSLVPSLALFQLSVISQITACKIIFVISFSSRGGISLGLH